MPKLAAKKPKPATAKERRKQGTTAAYEKWLRESRKQSLRLRKTNPYGDEGD